MICWTEQCTVLCSSYATLWAKGATANQLWFTDPTKACNAVRCKTICRPLTVLGILTSDGAIRYVRSLRHGPISIWFDGRLKFIRRCYLPLVNYYHQRVSSRECLWDNTKFPQQQYLFWRVAGLPSYFSYYKVDSVESESTLSLRCGLNEFNLAQWRHVSWPGGWRSRRSWNYTSCTLQESTMKLRCKARLLLKNGLRKFI